MAPAWSRWPGQSNVSFEIVVVDDASTDGTRAIAQAFSSVRVVDAGPPPPGWTGKNNAMAAGAGVARGEWLLFTDADTVHKPGSLARAVSEAQAARGIPAFLLSPAGGSQLLGKGGNARHFCRAGGYLPAFPGERSPFGRRRLRMANTF